MKAIPWIVGIGLVIVGLTAAGYFGLPLLIERQTAELRSDVKDAKEKLAEVDAFMKKEEAARRAGPLPTEADVQRIIKNVNDLHSKTAALEASFRKDLSLVQEAIKEQASATGEALRQQSESADRAGKEAHSRIQRIMFEASMAEIRDHILKVQMELISKNIGIAKNEADVIYGILEKMKPSFSLEEKKVIEDLQGNLKKAKEEMEINLPAAMNRIDLLWHGLGKLPRKE